MKFLLTKTTVSQIEQIFYPTKITRYTVIAVYYNLGVQFVSEYIIKSFYDKASEQYSYDG